MQNYTDEIFDHKTSEQMKAYPFQIIGFDIMLDKKGWAYLLEINNSPSLNINFELDNGEEKIKEFS